MPVSYEADGGETLVNTTTIGDQYMPSIVTLSDGGFVVSWMTYAQDGTSYGVYAQRYDVNGTPVGGEFRVSSATTDFAQYPSITALSDSGFVVSWTSSGHDGSGWGIYAQRYSADGSAAGGEFLVNMTTAGSQYLPSITSLSDGGFVVSWMSGPQDGSANGVYAQRYSVDGAPMGGEFRVNSTTADEQMYPSITGLADGGFVVSWMSFAQDGSVWGIYAQRYNADGSAAGGEFLVNTTTASHQESPTIAALSDGGFVVAWQSYTQDGSSYGVYAQRYAADGTRVGGEFLVNSTTSNHQQYASITGLSDGGFVVSWMSYDDSEWGIYAQSYAADGTRVGGEFLVNTTTANSQIYPAIAALSDGGFVVSWASAGQDGSGYGIYSQRYAAASDSIDGDDSDNTLNGTSGDDVINGLGGNDSIYASMGNDIINGGDGAGDWLLVAARAPGRFTQSGSQTYVITADSITSSSGSMNTSFSGIEFITFNNYQTVFGDTIDASGFQSASDELFVLTIVAGDGNDTIIGSAESDAIYAYYGINTIDAGAGWDEVAVRTYVTSGQTVYVTASNGVVQTTQAGVVTNSISNGEVIWVLGNNPTGSVTIDASGLVGFDGFLILGDNVGSDILIGSAGTDIFANIDNFTGGGDTFTGNGGADTFEYTYAIDGMDGDVITDFDWDDIIDLSNNGAVEAAMGYELADTFIGNAAFSGAAGEYRYETVGTTTIVQVDTDGDGIANETLTLANGAYALAETEAGSNLLQIAGERVIGGEEADTLTGSEVIDLLNGLAGADTMIGLGGSDIYYVDDIGDQAIEAFSEGIDSVQSSVSFTLGANVENLTLTDSPGSSSGTALAAGKGDVQANSAPPVAQSAAVNATGNELDNAIQGNSIANTLRGEGGNDTLNGGSGADTLIGGSGADTLTGGEGRDSFTGSAAELNGDTITDFSPGDRIVISDANLAGFEYSLSGSTLTYSGGSLTLANGTTGPFLVSAAAEGGVQISFAPPTRAKLILTEAGQDVTIGGNVSISGTTAGGEVVEVVRGDIELDASFNLGGDAVVLPGSAGGYSVSFSGSFVILSGGDISIAIPVGVAGLDVHFADSTRTLRFDTTSGQVMLGDQPVSSTIQTVTAIGAPRAELTAEGPASLAKLLLTEAGQDIDIGGNVTIVGTSGGGEVMTILGGTIMLDASFNVGGDTVVLPGNAASYTASLSGSFVTISGGDISIAIPVGVNGLTVDFADADKMLRFDTTSGQVMLGDQVVTSSGGSVAAMAQPGGEKDVGALHSLAIETVEAPEADWIPRIDYDPSFEVQRFEFSETFSVG